MVRSVVRRVGWVVAGAVLVAVVAGCGSADDRASAGGGSASGTAGAPGPVTITHEYGTTTIPSPPTKVVSIDTQWTDVLIAMDRPPAAYALDPTTADGSFPWRKDALAGSTGIPFSDSIPYEKIAEQAPDLIVATWAVQSEADYQRLSAIAPTIPSLSEGDHVDAWPDLAAVAGEVYGEPATAATLVADADAATAALGTELPGLRGKTVAMANYVAGDGIWVIADEKDGSSVVFAQIGLELSDTILALPGVQAGRVKLSPENLAMLDTDVLVLLTNGTDPSTIPGYAALPSVRSGAVAVLDYTDVVGLNTPTPLSVPHSLAKIRPALEAAAKA